MQEFYCKTKLVSGENALDWLDKQQCRTLLLVADPYFVENGWAEKIAGRVKAEKRTYFSNIKPDPTVELAAEGTALMRQENPDMLIALGGGSAMDTAKAMVYFAGEGVKFIAIPTTSGSGSEVTNFAILTHGEVKHPLIDKKMQPDVAIIADCLVEKLPPALVADGGFDVLSHALESFVATNATPLTQALAGSAFATAFAGLPASYRGDTRVRGKLHLASTMAGMAFSGSGLGLCHALSHSLGGIFHLPHGRLNAILLPEVITCNAVYAGAEYAKLARMAGLGGSADSIGHLNKASGTSSAYRGLGSIDFRAAARSVLLIGRLKNDPTVRVIVHDKSSLAPEGMSLAFGLGDEEGFRWLDGYDGITSEELLCGFTAETKTATAEELIRNMLAGGQEIMAEDVFRAAQQRGISRRTVNEAKKSIPNIVTKKNGKCWFWSLP